MKYTLTSDCQPATTRAHLATSSAREALQLLLLLLEHPGEIVLREDLQSLTDCPGGTTPHASGEHAHPRSEKNLEKICKRFLPLKLLRKRDFTNAQKLFGRCRLAQIAIFARACLVARKPYVSRSPATRISTSRDKQRSGPEIF